MQPRSVTPPTQDRPQAPTARVQTNMSPASKRSKPGKLQPALTPAVTRGRTPSPVVAMQKSVRCEEWSCSACTLRNPKNSVFCGSSTTSAGCQHHSACCCSSYTNSDSCNDSCRCSKEEGSC